MRRYLLFGVIALVAGVAGFTYRERLRAAWREWFWAPMHPMSLAIFRAVLFVELFVTANPRITLEYAMMPKALQYPPGIASLVDWNPSSGGAHVALLVFQVACVLGFLGLFTRASALTAVVTGTYVLGLPQLFGKVNHCHHLLWFALLIAFGPPSLALSLDGIWHAFRRADQGDVEGPKPEVAHGLPLKLAVCLMGLMYVFPGVWKILTGGPDWVIPANTARLMHADWLMMGHWLPPVRLDGMPILLFLGAAGTIVFELAFFPLVLFKRTRPLAGVGGIIFHNLTYLNLGIRFGTLQAMYVALIDWFWMLKRLGARFWKSPYYVVYDGDCRFCRRVLATIKTFELFDQLVYVNGQAVQALPDGTPIPFSREELLVDIKAYEDGQWHSGHRVYARMLRRVPKLWIALPLFALPGFMGRVYRAIADNRHKLIRARPPFEPAKLQTWPVLMAGGALFGGVLILGLMDDHFAWPIASYPTYEAVVGPKARYLGFQTNEAPLLENPAGAAKPQFEVPQFDVLARERFMGNRLNGMMGSILRDKDADHQRAALRAFWAEWRPGREMPRVVELESDTDPAHWQDTPTIIREIPVE